MKNWKIKKSLSLILSLIMLMSTLSILTVTSFAETSGDWEYISYIENGKVNGIEITKFNGYLRSVTIPSKINGNVVKSIGYHAFSQCSSIEKIVLPSSVKHIGYEAFFYCKNLKEVILPNSITEIEDSAFELCETLESINIPTGITTINFRVFGSCHSLKKIEIPYNVRNIKNKAFENCESLSSIILYDGLIGIADNALEGCSSLKNINIPKSVQYIGYENFNDCKELLNINVDINNSYYSSIDGVLYSKNLDTLYLYPRGKKDNTYRIPEGVKTIDKYAFYNCEYIGNITIPSSVTNINNWAFDNCYSLNYLSGYAGSYAEKYAKQNSIPFYEIGTFPDVAWNSWYYSSVKYVSKAGYITGYANGNFGPNDSLKRQDFVCILARIDGADLSKYEIKTSKLKDVQKGAYYAPAVNWAVEKGYVSGYKNGKFGVNDPITREQICVIMINYINKETDYFAGINGDGRGSDEIIDDFKDGYKVSPWAVESVGLAIDSGVISGMSDGKIAPTENASRAQIAAIIQRMDTQGMFDK